MKKCRRCDSAIGDDAWTCPECGALQSDPLASLPPSGSAPPKPYVPGTCLNCGRPRILNAKYCNGCGRPFPDIDAPVSMSPESARVLAVCPKCFSPRSEGAKFCRSCGVRFEPAAPQAEKGTPPAAVRCPVCSSELSNPDSVFCNMCGSRLPAAGFAQPAAPPDAPAPAGDAPAVFPQEDQEPREFRCPSPQDEPAVPTDDLSLEEIPDEAGDSGFDRSCDVSGGSGGLPGSPGSAPKTTVNLELDESGQ